MSDHWNSIADLLGTPSLSPIQKKSDPNKLPKKPEATTASAEQESRTSEKITIEPEKPKTEPSRLRSSWDAVAQFFGVGGSEPAAETPAEPSVSSRAPESSTPSVTKKSKPSMWGDPEPISAPVDPESAELDVASVPDARREARSGRGRGDRNETPRSGRPPRSAPPPRTPTVSRDIDDDIDPIEERLIKRDAFADDVDEQDVAPKPSARSEREPRERGPRGEGQRDGHRSEGGRGRGGRNAERGADRNSDRQPTADRSERDLPAGDEVDAERRSHRRPPRRGRVDADVEPVAESPEVDDFDLDVVRPRAERTPAPAADRDRGDRERSDRDRHDRGSRRGRDESRSSSTERPERSERPSRPERADRPERTDRSESSDRSPRADRSERSSRGERSERPSRNDRSGSRSSSTGDARSERARPAKSNRVEPIKPSGFGAGITDDLVIDDQDELLDDEVFQEVLEDTDDAVVEEEVDVKPRRRRGRRRRSREPEAGETAEAGESADVAEEFEEIGDRHSKTPSWFDAIGALVSNNMQNHQRTPANQGRGNNRGRGGRR